MAKSKKIIAGKKADEVKSATKKFSPFKDVKELRKEIVSFLNIHKTKVKNHAKRISDYFEMCCFNYVVRFYENLNYQVNVKNLQSGKYRYKCSTQGNQSNFSFFSVTIQIENEICEFEIHHNLAAESFHGKEIYTTPDISIINAECIKINKDFYEGNKTLSFVENKNLISFCEVKQFNPFPELIFNFIGTVNEIKHDFLNGFFEELKTAHLAPSLMISGKPNSHASRIKESLEDRYCINIIYDLFSSGSAQFSRAQVHRLRKIEKDAPAALLNAL